MPTGQQYATNVPQTTLSAGIAAGTTSFGVASLSSWPATPFTAVLDIGTSLQEPIDVLTVSGNTITSCTRAIDSTTAFAHSAGATLTHADIGRDFREARTHMDASTNVHGLSGGAAVVGDIQTQTLTNKTLTSPHISTILNTGTLTLPTSTDTLVGRATTDTLTNKTLTTPTINGSGGLLTLPAGPDTLVGRATTDTLTNKTLTSPIINTPTLNGSGGALALPVGPETLVGSGHVLFNGAQANSSTNFTTTTEADVTNSSSFTTTHAGATLFIWAYFDMQVITNGTGVGLGFITVDNLDSSFQAIYAMTTTGLRSTVAQGIAMTLGSTGTHTIKLRGSLSAASGSLTFNATHTHFVYLVLDF